MSMRGAALDTPRSGVGRIWVSSIAIVAVIAMAALTLAAIALTRAPALPASVERPAAVNTSIYERSAPITGTGPDLVAVAGAFLSTSQLIAIYRQSAPVTGTGPDLVQVADQP
jgi:hypothetical protein